MLNKYNELPMTKDATHRLATYINLVSIFDYARRG